MIAQAVTDLIFPRRPASRLARIANSLENPAVSLNDPETWDALTGGIESESGTKVSASSALSLAPVWQSVSIISGDVASIGLHLYKQEAGGDRELQLKDEREFAVDRRANVETSAFTFWRRMMIHSLLWPDAYGYIKRPGRAGQASELYNLLPDRTCPERDKQGNLYYATEVDGKMEVLKKEEVFHLQGLSIDNGRGCDLVAHARNSWGLALAAENFSSKFFAHGAHAGGILEIPASFTQKAADNLEEGFRKRLGKDQWFRTTILREGAKFHQVTVDAERSQLHQLREDQVRDVARFFNLPPFKLGISDSQSYNSVEQAQLHYLTGTLWHWLVAIQDEAAIKLLTEQELRSGSHFFEHDAEDVARPDLKTIEEILEIRRRNEIINANEWRQKVGMNRRKDKGGEEYANPNTKAPSPGGFASGPAKSLRNLVCRDAGRIARRVTSDLKHKAKKPGDVLAWIDTKAHEHRQAWGDCMADTIALVAEAMGQDAATLAMATEVRFFTLAIGVVEQAVTTADAAGLPGKLETLFAGFDALAWSEISKILFPGGERENEDSTGDSQ